MIQSFESEDEIKVEATGMQRQVGPKAEDVGTVSRGSYSYISPEGIPITLSWTADENGFRPVGSHLPVAPPMPDYVVEMLANLKNQPKTSSDSYGSTQTTTTYVQEVKAAPAPRYVQQEVKAAPTTRYVQQEIKAAPAPSVTRYVQQEIKAAPAPQVKYVQQEVKQAPAPQRIVMEVKEAPQVQYVQQEVKAAPAPQVQYVQEVIRAAPEPQPTYVVQEVVRTAPETHYVIKTEEVVKAAPAPAVRQIYGASDDSQSVIRTASKSGRQIFRVTFPESASK